LADPPLKIITKQNSVAKLNYVEKLSDEGENSWNDEASLSMNDPNNLDDYYDEEEESGSPDKKKKRFD